MTARLGADGFREPFSERVLAPGLGGTRRDEAADGGGRRDDDDTVEGGRREDAAEGGGRREDAADGGGRRELPLGRGGYLPSVDEAIDCDGWFCRDVGRSRGRGGGGINELLLAVGVCCGGITDSFAESPSFDPFICICPGFSVVLSPSN